MMCAEFERGAYMPNSSGEQVSTYTASDFDLPTYQNLPVVTDDVVFSNPSFMSNEIEQMNSNLNGRLNLTDDPNLSSIILNDVTSSKDEFVNIEPMARDRCNTWPMRRPAEMNQTLPMSQDKIDEEISSSNSSLQKDDGSLDEYMPQHRVRRQSLYSQGSPESEIDDPACKKSNSRRNAWGNMSYADLITQAILSSPEKRLTLSQVYEWMVQNVPYFRDKGDSNSSAGWKNSIRHNLSLHSRFMRIQNEGAGKSSWWVINPDAKPGRNPRRRSATMETTTKTILDKKRRGVRKRMDMVNESSLSSLNESAQSQRDFLDRDEGLGASDYEPFRSRTQSNVSMPGQRMTPPMEGFEDYKFPPWSGQQISQPASGATINDLLDRTDQIRLDTEEFRQMRASGQLVHPVKTEQKNEPPSNQQPFYQELCVVRGPDNLQNPLLCNQFSMSASSAPKPASMQCASNASFYPYGVHNSQNRLWNSTNPVNSMALNSNGLPIDLENVNTFESSNLDYDMEAVLRHELNSANGLSFDL
ncbi:unnamed protein product [Bursaphelenchus xylophilus]|uniref:Forkhead box protein O n=1 Tax=Bursaphelenchus xylophilus TaxID=6326 RepID=A0A7I8XID5_BURXY|nr:unnamed protein product [Bursaphelenchus xylophilus]CAG9085284.1 unnamed protein product [Bursaphelenchus xylophilus]